MATVKFIETWSSWAGESDPAERMRAEIREKCLRWIANKGMDIIGTPKVTEWGLVAEVTGEVSFSVSISTSGKWGKVYRKK